MSLDTRTSQLSIIDSSTDEIVVCTPRKNNTKPVPNTIYRAENGHKDLLVEKKNQVIDRKHFLGSV